MQRFPYGNKVPTTPRWPGDRLVREDGRDISAAADLGALIRIVRKEQGLTQADLAGASGVVVRFVIDLEAGKPTCEFDKALKVTRMLGLRLRLEP